VCGKKNCTVDCFCDQESDECNNGGSGEAQPPFSGDIPNVSVDLAAELSPLALHQCYGLTAVLVLPSMVNVGARTNESMSRVDFERVVKDAASSQGIVAQVVSVSKFSSNADEMDNTKVYTAEQISKQLLYFDKPLVIRVAVQPVEQRQARSSEPLKIGGR
jgi:hypothetical protein